MCMYSACPRAAPRAALSTFCFVPAHDHVLLGVHPRPISSNCGFQDSLRAKVSKANRNRVWLLHDVLIIIFFLATVLSLVRNNCICLRMSLLSIFAEILTAIYVIDLYTVRVYFFDVANNSATPP